MKVIYHPKAEKELLSLPNKEDKKIANVVIFFETNGFLLSAEHLKKLTTEIWELRTGRYRVLFGFIKNVAVITNFFYKKTQKTPKGEIELAVSRLKQYL